MSEENLESVKLPPSLTTEGEEAEDPTTLFTMIGKMSVSEKTKLALTGNKLARAILIQDTSKQIPQFVLQNPGITEQEIVDFTANKEISELVLRSISKNSTWIKNYQIKRNFVGNPKVPVDISMKWIKHLQEKDLRTFAKSKNIPQVVARQCRKTLERRNKK